MSEKDQPKRLYLSIRGRAIAIPLIEDPQNIFASRVSDPSDWDYAPFSAVAAEAVDEPLIVERRDDE